MKKLLIILLLFSMSLHADYEFSFRGGMNMSNYKDMRIGASPDIDYKLGFVLFLSMKKDINDKFYFGLDLGYNQKGGKVYYKEDMDMKNYKRTFHTVEMPIILGYNLVKDSTRLSFYSGLYYSLVIVDRSSEAVSEGDGTTHTLHRGPFNEDNELIGDYGFLFGFEYCYNNIIFDFRYQRGFGVLKRMDDELEMINTNTYASGSSQFLLMLGYRF